VVALLTLGAVSAGTVLVSREIAEQGAVEEAERTAVLFARHLIEPVLTEALSGVPGRWDELDRRVADRLSDGSIESVAIWIPPGEILFASEKALRGLVVEPMPEVRTAWAGAVVAHVDETAEDFGGLRAAGEGPQLEVYVPVEIGEQRLTVEVRFGYDSIARQAEVLRNEIVPLAVGSLLLMQLVQMPIAVWLVRRVRRHEVERADLLARSYTASERERRALAGDVHDGPVQELAGVSYALSALRSGVAPDRRVTVDRLASCVREAVSSLRRLMVDLYPPDLSGSGLTLAVDDLADRLRAQGVTVFLSTEPLPSLAPEVAAVVYRSAKEALVNAEKHASPTRVWVDLASVAVGRTSAIRLQVSDDGVGLAGRSAARDDEGHFGLRLLRDRAEELGGTAAISERPGGGTSVQVVVPAFGRASSSPPAPELDVASHATSGIRIYDPDDVLDEAAGRN
jgi:signal transduction histidine kinase